MWAGMEGAAPGPHVNVPPAGMFPGATGAGDREPADFHPDPSPADLQEGHPLAQTQSDGPQVPSGADRRAGDTACGAQLREPLTCQVLAATPFPARH